MPVEGRLPVIACARAGSRVNCWLAGSSAAAVAGVAALAAMAAWGGISPSWGLAIVAAGGVAGVAGVAFTAGRLFSQASSEAAGERDALYREVSRLSKLAALGEVSASIVHDLNNPLGIMNEEAGWLQDLLGGAGAGAGDAAMRQEFASSVEQVQIQIGRCRELARRYLTWTRDPKDGDAEVDLNALVAKTLYLVEAELTSSGVQVVKRLQPGLPTARASAAELRQVLLHLMKNALDAMAGGGSLTITSLAADGGVVVRVADTGPGIPSDLVGRLFEPFFTTKGEGDGTGLGLPISRWIVRRLGGRIDVESVPGHGTVFSVWLPAGPGASPRPAA